MKRITPTNCSVGVSRDGNSTEKLSLNAGPSMEALPVAFQELVDAARQNSNRGVLRARPTANKAGMALSTLWRDVKNGVFAPPIRISERSVAWVEAEVDAILAAKALMSRSKQRIDFGQFVTALTSPNGAKQPRTTATLNAKPHASKKSSPEG